MKRRIATTAALAALAVLAMASVAHAATVKPKVVLSASLSGNTYSLTCSVTPLAKSRTITLHSQVRVTDASGAPVGPKLPWINQGNRHLSLRYGNRGYWVGTITMLLSFSPPLIPTDHIVVAWVASYGRGTAKAHSAQVLVQVQ